MVVQVGWEGGLKNRINAAGLRIDRMSGLHVKHNHDREYR
jgi:hypothetical protein